MAVKHTFQYYRPHTLEEAVELMDQYDARVVVLAGGTDLVLNIDEGTDRPDVLVDIKDVTALREITLEKDRLIIGAAVTFNDIIESDSVNQMLPLLVEAAKTVGSVSIRNRATLVGNICSSVPCLDSGPALLLHEAKIHVIQSDGSFTLDIADWFLEPRRTALQPGQIVTGISIPVPKQKHAGCYVRLSRYRGEDLAQAGVGILILEPDEVRVAFNAVAPVPARSRRIESLLSGHPLTPERVQEAVNLIPEEISPITDIRATREYRMHMVKVMFKRGLNAAVSRLAGNGPPYGTPVI